MSGRDLRKVQTLAGLGGQTVHCLTDFMSDTLRVNCYLSDNFVRQLPINALIWLLQSDCSESQSAESEKPLPQSVGVFPDVHRVLLVWSKWSKS